MSDKTEVGRLALDDSPEKLDAETVLSLLRKLKQEGGLNTSVKAQILSLVEEERDNQPQERVRNRMLTLRSDGVRDIGPGSKITNTVTFMVSEVFRNERWEETGRTLVGHTDAWGEYHPDDTNA